MLRIIFMGTPSFAVPALESLIANRAPGVILPDGYEIVTVITRPDKPVGRGKEIVFSPVKQAALAHGIPVWQPGSLKRPETIEALAAYRADLFIVAAFGQILPQAVLDLPRYGTLNIHASLLPRYRGVSPISAAILQGENETGVTIMLIDAGVDTGHILLKRRIPISPAETTGSLTEKLARLGAEALMEVLPLWIGGKLTPQPQDEQQASYTRMVRKEDGLIDWHLSADMLARQVRAYNPWPGAHTHWRGKLLKILAAHPIVPTHEPEELSIPTGESTVGAGVEQGGAGTLGSPSAPLKDVDLPEAGQEKRVGLVTLRKEDGQSMLLVTTGEGLLAVDRLQLEGKKAMSAEEFLRGYPQIVGDILE